MTNFSCFRELFSEDTSTGDIAVFTGKMPSKDCDCEKLDDCSCEDITETAPGVVGRTGYADADKHLSDNPELIKRFKKIVKELGGITATRKLMMQLSSTGTI